MDNDIVRRLDRIREIGREITTLKEEAKTARGEVRQILERSTHAPQPGKPTRILHEDTVVTVALSEDGKECSVTFEDLELASEIGSEAAPF